MKSVFASGAFEIVGEKATPEYRVVMLLSRQPPYRAAPTVTRAVWHQRNEHDAGHAWLRERVAAAAKTAQGPAEAA